MDDHKAGPVPKAKGTVGEASSPPVRLFRGILEAVTGIDEQVRQRFDDESLCQRCGKCCHAAIRVRDRMVLLQDLPCRYLSYQEDGHALCTVYHLREFTGWCCQTSVESVRKELYPPDCPYVQDIPHYRGKIELSAEEFEEIKPVLRKIFKGWPRPSYVTAKAWERFIHRTLELPPPG
ncbi:MAG: hypothetical protein R6V10_06960 [bacterium]